MTTDNTNTPGYGVPSAAAAEAQALTRAGEIQGDAQRRTNALPSLGLDGPDLARMCPPGVDPRAYIRAMVSRAEGTRDRGSDEASSAKVGALPVDNSALTDGRSAGGFSRTPSQLKPGDTVAWNGTRVEVEQAVSLGLLQRAATGGYELPSAAEQAQVKKQQVTEERQQAQEAAADLPAQRASGDACDAETAGVLDIVSRHVPPQAADVMVRDFVSNGTLSLKNVTEVSAALGWSQAQGAAVATKAIEGLTRQAHTAAVAAGVPAHEVNALWSWAAERDPGAHRNAAMALAYGEGTAGLKALAKAYLADKRAVRR